jgi:hypothetical protein
VGVDPGTEVDRVERPAGDRPGQSFADGEFNREPRSASTVAGKGDHRGCHVDAGDRESGARERNGLAARPTAYVE